MSFATEVVKSSSALRPLVEIDIANPNVQWVNIGAESGSQAVLENCVLWDGVQIGEGARLKGCIVGNGARIGAHVILNRLVLGAITLINSWNRFGVGFRDVPGSYEPKPRAERHPATT